MKIKTIHFVGIKGVGMAPLAIIAKEAGFKISGCDLDQEFITDVSLKKAKIEPLIGFDKAHVEKADLVITTGAHGGYDNPEVVFARQKNIPVFTQGEAVGKFLNGDFFGRVNEGISVAGSHGKTTTTAIIATILKENKLDPSYLIGTGSVSSLGSCGHFGTGKYFVAEADEYANEPKHDITPKFLFQKPKIGVITNIEFDHPDIYPSMNELRIAFLNFANNVQADGCLLICIDDAENKQLLRNYKKRAITYGFSKNADYNIQNLNIEEDKMFFWVNAKETLLGEFLLNITGEHNALNALCAIVACLELGLSIENIKKGLLAFKGTDRRAEFIGVTASGAKLYDDYAHHPTEISTTLKAFKKSFMNKKIVCIFQPHTYSRTKKLFEQFIHSFNDADVVIITDIFPSAREKVDLTVAAKFLADEIAKKHNNVIYLSNLANVIKYLDQKQFDSNYLILTMGAGDVYTIAKEIIV